MSCACGVGGCGCSSCQRLAVGVGGCGCSSCQRLAVGGAIPFCDLVPLQWRQDFVKWLNTDGRWFGGLVPAVGLWARVLEDCQLNDADRTTLCQYADDLMQFARIAMLGTAASLASILGAGFAMVAGASSAAATALAVVARSICQQRWPTWQELGEVIAALFRFSDTVKISKERGADVASAQQLLDAVINILPADVRNNAQNALAYVDELKRKRDAIRAGRLNPNTLDPVLMTQLCAIDAAEFGLARRALREAENAYIKSGQKDMNARALILDLGTRIPQPLPRCGDGFLPVMNSSGLPPLLGYPTTTGTTGTGKGANVVYIGLGAGAGALIGGERNRFGGAILGGVLGYIAGGM